MYKSSNITLMVNDLDRSSRFYNQTLGLAIKEGRDGHYILIDACGLTVALHAKRGDEKTIPGNGQMSIGLEVTDLAAAVQRLEALGVGFQIHESDINRFAFFNDPDGTSLYLMESKA